MADTPGRIFKGISLPDDNLVIPGGHLTLHRNIIASNTISHFSAHRPLSDNVRLGADGNNIIDGLVGGLNKTSKIQCDNKMIKGGRGRA